VPDTLNGCPINLPEMGNRAQKARHIIAGFSLSALGLAGLWRQVDDALAGIPALTSEIARLRDVVVASRIDRANLAAAAHVVMTAYHNSEADPFAYLRDELEAQGFGAWERGRWDV
jgi:hypothetical protein